MKAETILVLSTYHQGRVASVNRYPVAKWAVVFQITHVRMLTLQTTCVVAMELGKMHERFG